MRKPRGLKVRGYAARLVGLNEYLTVLPGANISDKIFVTELNDFFQTVCPTSGSSRRVYKYFIVNLLPLNQMLTCFNALKQHNIFTNM